MLERLCIALLFLLLAIPALAQEPTEPAEPTPDIILVPGQRPGPGLWKVAKGDHVLWIFGTYGPLPQNMAWRSQEVEAILAQSQEYLLPPSATASVGFFRQLTLLPYAIGFKKNPDGARLVDLVPAEVYARWLLLKQKYIGDDDGIERERPIFAAQTLYSKGLQKAGLSAGNDLRKTIEQLVKKNHLKMTPSNVTLAMDDPVGAIKDFKKSALDDVPCFAKTLDSLETDINDLRIRANAWAKGDLDLIAKLNFAERENACAAALSNSAFTRNRPQFQDVQQRMGAAWMATAEKSLAANRSTFAILPLKELLDPKGVLAALQAKGYEVRNPD